MIDIEMDLDRQDAKGVRNAPGTAFAGNKDNFYQGFNEYKRDLRNLHNRIQDKLEQIKEAHKELPWE